MLSTPFPIVNTLLSGKVPEKKPSTEIKGKMIFYDHFIPPLVAGEYTVSVKHEISAVNADKNDVDFGADYKPNAPGSKIKISTPPTQQIFHVDAPRFSIPREDIHAFYPLANSNGQFTYHLPYILFNKRIFPWERQLFSASPESPWLALLIFSENELEEMVNKKGIKSRVTNYRNEIKEDDRTLKIPKLDPLSDEDDPTCIQISAKLFKDILPREGELKYLAHCRKVDTTSKVSLELRHEGLFSVLFANRFPMASKKPDEKAKITSLQNIAHIVSMEGLYDIYKSLPDDKIEIEKFKVRLISLFSWVFYCTSEDAHNFENIAKNLITGINSKPDFLFRFPTAPAEANEDEDFDKCMNDGHVPLLHHTHTNEKLLAWYRGPFVPRAVQAVDPNQLNELRSFEKLLIYDDTFGVFDHSYVAAWQLGRVRALSDATYIDALRTFVKRKLHQNIKKIISPVVVGAAAAGDPESSDQAEKLFGLLDRMNQIILNPSKTKEEEKSDVSVPRDHKEIKSRLTDSLKQQDLINANDQEEDSYQKIFNWLVTLQLLKQVPFHYLVPHEKLLPAESIRFFQIDFNWVSALLAGALSVGIHSEDDLQIHLAILKKIKQDVTNKKVVSQCGFLLRSALVSGWPGLQIHVNKSGYHKHLEDTGIYILRLERLGEDLLLCLFNDVPPSVCLSEPDEQSGFGLSEGIIPLRDLRKGEYGKLFSLIKGHSINAMEQQSLAKCLRAQPIDKAGGAVLNLDGEASLITALTTLINEATHEVKEDHPREINNAASEVKEDEHQLEKITPAQFATQLIIAPIEIRFNPSRFFAPAPNIPAVADTPVITPRLT